jgi:hypothetical protein
MHNCDLEAFYKRIDGHIRLVSAYTEKPILSTIIRACRLKPISVFKKNFKYTTKLERHWVDEFGVYLKLDKKECCISYAQTTFSSTDLFYGVDIKTLLKTSKFALFAAGKNDCIILSLGQDNYLRCRAYTSGRWKIVSPLSLGLRTLAQFYNNIDNGFVNVIDKTSLDIIYPMLDVEKCVATIIPPNQNILSYFENTILWNKIGKLIDV